MKKKFNLNSFIYNFVFVTMILSVIFLITDRIIVTKTKL